MKRCHITQNEESKKWTSELVEVHNNGSQAAFANRSQSDLGRDANKPPIPFPRETRGLNGLVAFSRDAQKLNGQDQFVDATAVSRGGGNRKSYSASLADCSDSAATLDSDEYNSNFSSSGLSPMVERSLRSLSGNSAGHGSPLWTSPSSGFDTYHKASSSSTGELKPHFGTRSRGCSPRQVPLTVLYNSAVASSAEDKAESLDRTRHQLTSKAGIIPLRRASEVDLDRRDKGQLKSHPPVGCFKLSPRHPIPIFPPVARKFVCDAPNLDKLIAKTNPKASGYIQATEPQEIQFEAWTEPGLNEFPPSPLQPPAGKGESCGSLAYSLNSPQACSSLLSCNLAFPHFKGTRSIPQSPPNSNVGSRAESSHVKSAKMNRYDSLEGFRTTSLLTSSHSGLNFLQIPEKRPRTNDYDSVKSSLSDRCEDATDVFFLQFSPTINPSSGRDNIDDRGIDNALASGPLVRLQSEHSMASLGLAIDSPAAGDDTDNRCFFTPPVPQAPISRSPPPIRPENVNIPDSDATGNNSSQLCTANANDKSIRRAIYQMTQKSQN